MSKGQIAKKLLEFVASSGRPDAKIGMGKKKTKAPTKRTTRTKTEQESWEKVKKIKAKDRSATQKKTHKKLAKLKPFKETKAKAKANRSFKRDYEVEAGTGPESRGRSGSSDRSEFEVELGRAGKVTVGKASGANFLKDQAAVGGTRARAKKKIALERAADEGSKTAKAKVARMDKADAAKVDSIRRKQSGARTGKKSEISLAGPGGTVTKAKADPAKGLSANQIIGNKSNGIVRETGEVIGNPTPRQTEQAVRDLMARRRLDAEQKRNLAILKRNLKKFGVNIAELEGNARILEGRAEARRQIRNKAMGGLLEPTNKGLTKLPTAVRNKMGYKRHGGMPKRMGHTDYRKGGMFKK